MSLPSSSVRPTQEKAINSRILPCPLVLCKPPLEHLPAGNRGLCLVFARHSHNVGVRNESASVWEVGIPCCQVLLWSRYLNPHTRKYIHSLALPGSLDAKPPAQSPIQEDSREEHSSAHSTPRQKVSSPREASPLRLRQEEMAGNPSKVAEEAKPALIPLLTGPLLTQAFSEQPPQLRYSSLSPTNTAESHLLFRALEPRISKSGITSIQHHQKEGFKTDSYGSIHRSKSSRYGDMLSTSQERTASFWRAQIRDPTRPQPQDHDGARELRQPV